MKRFCLLAVLMLSAPFAHAGEGISFSIGGHRIHIDSTRCRAPSCVSVSDRSRRDDGAGRAPNPDRVPVATAAIPAGASASSAAATSAPSPVVVYKPAPAAPPPAVVPPPPAAPSPPRVMTIEPSPVVAASPLPAAPTPLVTRVSRETGDEPDDGPVGDWQTDTGSLVRVRSCGDALCGYALDKTTRDLGEAVLINMKPSKQARWSGGVYDLRRGSIHHGTIELQGADKMRVEACAFSGFYCTGTDWARVSHARHRVITQGALEHEPRS